MKLAISTLILVILSICLSASPTSADAVTDARLIARASDDCPGGICVVIGEDVTDLAAAMFGHGFVVQALVPDQAALEKARSAIRSSGEYGPVSTDRSPYNFLPYAENLINLIVVDDYPKAAARGLSIDEVFRVLAPFGSAYFGSPGSSESREAGWTGSLAAKLAESGFAVSRAGAWLKAVKPWPRNIDEWTHYLHDADGNPVANDSVVAPPEHYQWISGPLWLRSHESDSSVRTIVTSRGRLFYIADEAPISLLGDHDLPDKWFLIARDAFNGVPLWKVPIQDWGWRAWKPSWFTPRPGVIPLNIEKRLVAMDDKVYVTLGYRAPVSELDAKTGKVLKVYDGTARTAEILYRDGLLTLTVLEADRARVKMVDARSGTTLWASENTYGGTVTDYYRFTEMNGSVPAAKVDPTLNTATDGKVIALLDGEDVVCLDYRTGAERWRTTFPLAEADFKAGNIDALHKVWVGTLIVKDGVVVHASPNQLAAFSAASGEMLWSRPKKFLQHLWYEWKDVFVIDGLVWTWSAELAREKLDARGKPAKGASIFPVSVNGYDLHTGKLAKEVPLGNIFKTHHHHRCYRNKATLRYIIASRRGSEYVDLDQGNHSVHNWVRGTCHVGMMPANGLQYAPPHPCVCYIEEKLNGMNVLAPAIPAAYRQTGRDISNRLERGPAYGKLRTQNPVLSEAEGSKPKTDSDWPTYRHDTLRSGAAETEVPGTPQLLWQTTAGKKVGPPILADGRVFVPLVDEHHIASINAENGKKIWEAAAGARIDSPPTYHKGTVIFGSADGWAYCLRASDGALVWRFAAAPRERRIGAFGQLESAWPIHGSVLVRDGVAYFAAGRSSHLDGGVYLYGLDVATGELRYQTRLQGPHYDGDDISQNYQLPMGALPDILQSDDQGIYMRNLAFNEKLEEQLVRPRQAAARVFAQGGLLDDSYFKRIPWAFGGNAHSRLVVHDDKTAYFVRMFDSLQGLNPNVYFVPGKEGYLLFAIDKASGKQMWSQRIRVRVNAMVVTGHALFVAGPPDVVDPEDPLGAFEGRKGGVLCAIDPASGETTWKHELPAPPVFNGLIAAGGRVYVAMHDGTIACFGG